MSQSVAIRLRQCARRFSDDAIALHPLDLDINAGETLVLLGPSGCGKTTTLRIISGLEQPDVGGEVWFGDRNVTALPIEKRNVGMVFQHYALFPNMNVAQNVGYGLRIQGLPRIEINRRVEEMLTMVDLQHVAQRPVNALSGGQKQRVSLARALAARPKVLLFDEPLAALDVKLREKLREDIGQLLRQLHITAVYVTHDQQEAMALGDRIAVLEKGRIAQIATPQTLYQQPATRFVADFVGAINCLLPESADGPGLYCRPEDITPGAVEGAPHSGRIVQQLFLGASQRLIIDTGGQQPLQVDRPAREIWRSGQQVGLFIAADRLMHFHSKQGEVC
ncbi:ABC transporter ATP-binding protein [Erwiniaceae bacterium BAC15a-03b]|uniref:ABC transporter ATP-binding protein n=1 Tax=Winslowiella arboricola TaxID=2978220 RepID=A0A9J6PEC3_9GAMM|nr:ABC transporter ATP-binding protein [Winslowiella arboricola]MCU5771783.1 ABC transporter ATP-binding protein [Winslowiella arboricola]MCU5776633.1 ABC transporter ATP-binding protein [Winslowiella arboricola]